MHSTVKVFSVTLMNFRVILLTRGVTWVLNYIPRVLTGHWLVHCMTWKGNDRDAIRYRENITLHKVWCICYFLSSSVLPQWDKQLWKGIEACTITLGIMAHHALQNLRHKLKELNWRSQVTSQLPCSVHDINELDAKGTYWSHSQSAKF